MRLEFGFLLDPSCIGGSAVLEIDEEMKGILSLLVVTLTFLVLALAAPNIPDKHSESAVQLLQRFTRQATPAAETAFLNKKGGCKYRKSPWSACDPDTKYRSRTLTLRKGDKDSCEATKTLKKECKVKGGKGSKRKNKEEGQEEKKEEKKTRGRKKNKPKEHRES